MVEFRSDSPDGWSKNIISRPSSMGLRVDNDNCSSSWGMAMVQLRMILVENLPNYRLSLLRQVVAYHRARSGSQKKKPSCFPGRPDFPSNIDVVPDKWVIWWDKSVRIHRGKQDTRSSSRLERRRCPEVKVQGGTWSSWWKGEKIGIQTIAVQRRMGKNTKQAIDEKNFEKAPNWSTHKKIKTNKRQECTYSISYKKARIPEWKAGHLVNSENKCRIRNTFRVKSEQRQEEPRLTEIDSYFCRRIQRRLKRTYQHSYRTK